MVSLAGILPDADGLGLILDLAQQAFGGRNTFYYYGRYHHYLLHGALGAVLISLLMACFAHRKWRVALLALLVFHLHLLCDFVGSRGPDKVDLWPIFNFGPFDKDPMWIWKNQWPLDGWFNRVLTLFLFGWALRLAVLLGYSFVGVSNLFPARLKMGAGSRVGSPSYHIASPRYSRRLKVQPSSHVDEHNYARQAVKAKDMAKWPTPLRVPVTRRTTALPGPSCIRLSTSDFALPPFGLGSSPVRPNAHFSKQALGCKTASPARSTASLEAGVPGGRGQHQSGGSRSE